MNHALTPESKLDDQRFGQQAQIRQRFLWKVSFIAGLGGLLYGFDMGIIAAALVYLRDSFTLTTRMQEWIVSSVLVGAMTGALLGGVIADKVGRRFTLLQGGLLFIVGSALAFAAPNAATLIAARTLLGLAIGFTSVTAPVYVSELAPPQTRGMLIGLYQFALTLGIAAADLTGYLLAPHHAWRWMFGLGALPALAFVLLLLPLPESPRWLFAQGRENDAKAVLASYTDDLGASILLNDIRSALAIRIEKTWSALWSPAVRGSLLIAVGFTVLQQVTGINTIIYYGPRIFAQAGISSNQNAIFATFLISITNVVATIIALVTVDRIGRKPLLYTGITGMTIVLFLLAYSFHVPSAFGAPPGRIATICLMGYIICFAFSMGPIAWILASEVFPLQLRGRGVAAATLGSGASNFLVSLTFLTLIETAGSALTFVIYGIFCIVTLFFVRFIVPETKGCALESISSMNRSRAIEER